MACTNCSTKTDSNGVPRGCQSNGTCGTDSCNKLAVFDWLSNMVYPNSDSIFDIVEVRFKNGRKDFYRYPSGLTVAMGDIVATESSPGHDVGIVSLVGELVKVQMKKKKADPEGEILKIYRKATQKDIDIWQEVREKEEPVRMRAREIAINLNLEMKISDVEFQGDGSKATFYYTASERVDFRQLIKDFAREFSIRIEMKQVGFRQEAARLGGVGSCGRELCCSTWLTDFRSVNTAAARYQQLSLNPQKLAGQCGKLKCCLNFELDTYLEALKDMPDSDTKLMTVKGIAFCQKIDIFKAQMWFAYANNSANWYVLTTEQVKEILGLNAQNEKGNELESYSEDVPSDNDHFQNAVEQDSVTRFDQPKRRKKNTKSKGKSTDRDGNAPVKGAEIKGGEEKDSSTGREDRKRRPRAKPTRNVEGERKSEGRPERKPEDRNERPEGRPERRPGGRPERKPEDRNEKSEGRPERKPEGRLERKPGDRNEKPEGRTEGRSDKKGENKEIRGGNEQGGEEKGKSQKPRSNKPKQRKPRPANPNTNPTNKQDGENK
ncbi:regulatory iron-sulfur-containing complex subunit RicT [Myroides fluvii]|uniref:regulatory iron-sulfur-containing complex subunit RicT n=1 Tax=Myroides fluvii TaxID=2572594 RepID=UPI00131BB539|nr:regulatory iron-sulfur-containing complex subunit RicT [Myroides fluvii]